MKTIEKQGAVQELLLLGSSIHRKDGAHNVQVRPLSEVEWERIKYLCENNDLVLYLFQQAYGFVLGVYGQRSKGRPVEILLWLNEEDLPIPNKTVGFGGQIEVLNELFKITHSERNKRLIQKLDLEPLRDDPRCYTYA